MLLFVDETENEFFFIVGGVLVDSRESASAAYKRFKRRIKEYPITNNERMKIYTEFKSYLLDKGYQRIKLRMIEEIDQLNSCIIFSCYIKKEAILLQEQKEKIYIALLSRIVSSIEEDISIIFDRFNIPSFEAEIVQTISEYQNVQAIMPRDSQEEPGLQFADNVCSVLRQHKTEQEESECYKILKKRIREI